jgi:hypothetical protein
MKNLHLHPSDETLMAYADGELDEGVALAVETAMVSDPELIKELVGFTRSRRLARAAMSRGLKQASPELISAISAMARRPDTRPVEEKAYGWSTFLTSHSRMIGRGLAAAALLVFAGGLGHFLGASALVDPARTALSHLDDPDVSAALHKVASGERRSVAGGVLDPVATYRLEDGTLCRDYVLVAGQTKAEALACRHEGAWRTMAAITKPSSDAYVPASGETVIDAYLQEIKAGEPLSSEDEGRLLAR